MKREILLFMGKNIYRPIDQRVLQDDIEAYAGLLGISDYAPTNVAFEAANGTALKAAMEASQIKAIQDRAVYEASRDKQCADEWAFHDYIRNMRIQVKAQYGEDSDEVQTVGLKKKSEYKNPKRKPPIQV
jgi:hypothetical protein